MKVIYVVLFWIVSYFAYAESVHLHFIIEPKFNLEAAETISQSLKKHTENDSIKTRDFLCGEILSKEYSDRELVDFINLLACDFVAPTDYHFTENKRIKNSKFLSSNLQSSGLKLNQYELILSDSLKIGIITVNSPDQIVKNKISENVILNYDFFEITTDLAKALKKKTNFIILLSNLSKDIDEDLVKDSNIDVVISFDYQSRPNGKLSNNKTYWYSTKAHRGSIGTLQIEYKNGKVIYQWKDRKVTF
jgi:hypothetical protein